MTRFIRGYISLAEFLQKTLGNLYNVFILEYDDNKLNPIESDYVQEENIEKYFPLILEGIKDNKDTIINQAIETETEKLRKISVKMIRDEDESILGCICVSLKCSPFLKLEGLIYSFLNFDSSNNINENYPSTIDGLEKYIDDFKSKSPKLNKNEKTEIIIDLYDMGMFNIKGSVAKVAEKLNISTKSVYRYISKIKENRE